MEKSSFTGRPRFDEALRFWFKLGWISFGGTAGHIAIMHDYLVEMFIRTPQHRKEHQQMEREGKL